MPGQFRTLIATHREGAAVRHMHGLPIFHSVGALEFAFHNHLAVIEMVNGAVDSDLDRVFEIDLVYTEPKQC